MHHPPHVSSAGSIPHSANQHAIPATSSSSSLLALPSPSCGNHTSTLGAVGSHSGHHAPSYSHSCLPTSTNQIPPCHAFGQRQAAPPHMPCPSRPTLPFQQRQ